MNAAATARERDRIELMTRVRLRSQELEEAVFPRLLEGDYVSLGDGDAKYVAGLRAAVKATIEYALDDDIEARSAPPQAIAQARRAARLGVNLDTVLRRYVLGGTMLSDLLVEEAGNSDLGEHTLVLREVLREQAAVLEQLLASISSAYDAELKRGHASSAQRLVERVQALLAGAPGDLHDHHYDLDRWHVGAIATGAGAAHELQRAADALQATLLYVPCGDDMAWAWLGGRGVITVSDVELALLGGRRGARAGASEPVARGAGPGRRELAVALGEPAWALEGWRLTHRQAQAAMRVALRAPQPLTRYADVAILAAVLRDDVLADSMIEVYLSPLGDRRGVGAPLRETLRAYYKADCNASSAARVLGVTRHTVENRLRAVEQKLDHTLHTRQAELEVALRVEELTHGFG